MRVEHQPDAERYVLLDGEEMLGLLDYYVTGNTIRFTHSEIDPGRRNAGLGGKLVQDTLDQVRAETSYRVDPACPFMADWLVEHPEYQELTQR
ncbi:GNAT family N-acetyltransferase [Lysobacter korlensis]|uniref:GNAT family N-acetyltransferase n=1 Tax=Lysobacter korlensis TaxID=553636 RepID=A0ABV6RT46_9GAMM